MNPFVASNQCQYRSSGLAIVCQIEELAPFILSDPCAFSQQGWINDGLMNTFFSRLIPKFQIDITYKPIGIVRIPKLEFRNGLFVWRKRRKLMEFKPHETNTFFETFS
mmetsp:Transcript_18115/g.27423  ORF Transcript_18115/g.27423 Transcript_18115/m.27423 type:complete len:108 (+) Transcript_18115:211-534(+)